MSSVLTRAARGELCAVAKAKKTALVPLTTSKDACHHLPRGDACQFKDASSWKPFFPCPCHHPDPLLSLPGSHTPSAEESSLCREEVRCPAPPSGGEACGPKPPTPARRPARPPQNQGRGSVCQLLVLISCLWSWRDSLPGKKSLVDPAAKSCPTLSWFSSGPGPLNMGFGSRPKSSRI